MREQSINLPNGWESVSVIGEGSFGVVYRTKRTIGQHTEWAAVKHISVPRNQVELRMICSELGTRDERTVNEYLNNSLQDMLGEYFQMKALLGHPNIVACQDIQQIPKQDGPGYDVYIWMELLESLSNRIIDGKMDRNETIRLGMDICNALSLLKANGIVHRDISPQNIFVNRRGDFKLGDFGSAREMEGTSDILTMKGKFSYTAPEVMKGEPASFNSDLYSLGLVMYRLMNRNRHPFIQEGKITSRRGLEDSNYRRLGGEILPMPVDVDEELGRIILKACAFEPRNRWQTPEEMFNALAALNEGTTVQKYQSSVTDTSGNVAQGEDSIKTTHSTDKESSITSKNQNSQEEISTTTKAQNKPNSDSHEEERKTAVNQGKKKPFVFIIAAACILLLSIVAIVKLIGKKESQGTIVAITTEAAVATVSPVAATTSPASNNADTALPTMVKTTLKVGASITPHAEILREAAKLLEKQGITLDIVEYTDYVQPNTAVEDGSLNANYFQHTPYLNTFNAENKTHLVSVGPIHYETFGIYAGKVKSLADLPNGANIGVPNDGSNETRALLLLQQEGIIKLKDGIEADSIASKLDIVENPRNINIVELEASLIPEVLADLDFGIINGNYALQAGLNAGTDALAVEDASGSGAQTYANVLCVKEGNEKNEAIQALYKALTSEEVKAFINNTYSGAVVPIDDVRAIYAKGTSVDSDPEKVDEIATFEETTTGSAQPEGTVRGTISSGSLALREGPGVTYKSLGQYYEGKLVYVLYQEGDYYYVFVAGTELKGYMPAQFITAEGPVPNKDS